MHIHTTYQTHIHPYYTHTQDTLVHVPTHTTHIHTHLLSVLRPLLFFSSHPCLMASCSISKNSKTSLWRIAQRRIQPWRLLP